MIRSLPLRAISYALAFFLLTVLFFITGFPVDRITSRINAALIENTGGALTIGSTSVSFPVSIRLSGLAWYDKGKDYDLGEARLKPHLLSILGQDKKLDAYLSGKWGQARVTLGSGPVNRSIEAQKVSLDLASLPGMDELPVRISGILQGRGDINQQLEGKRPVSGNGSLNTDNLTLSGGALELFKVPPVTLKELSVSWVIKKSVLTVRKGVIEGDLRGTIKGSVRIDTARPERSRLDLTIEMRPSIESAERLTPLFSLLGADNRPDKGVIFKIRGTVASPSVSY